MNLRKVAELCRHDGPYLSVYLDVSRDTEEAARAIDARWRAAADRLLDRGAPQQLLAEVADRMLALTGVAGSAGRMVVAAREQILVDEVVPCPEHVGVVDWGPLPDVTGWLADIESARSVLLVLADRAGADLELYDAWPGRPVERRTVQGETLHLTKVPAGDWAHKEYQRRTEEVWRGNAREVAAEVDRQVRSGAQLVAVAGDVRARTEIEHAVGEATRAHLVELEHGSRAPGSSRESLEKALRGAVRETIIQEKLAVIRELQEHAGRGDRVALGVSDVLDKLVLGQVDRLLVTPSEAAKREARPADHPGLPLPSTALATDRLRADLATICAAAETDAQLVVTGPRTVPGDGIAALLRWE